ncbi:S8 family serine peptidase [Cellulomonas sp. A375-1]|uniref:S8 family serine peptidase n=1 Tax=Cellulomonas sp. A375-1 TaxID=1672219 RepID=UPI00069DE97C|nr:S8 family serine peptidase [Cellulomonas sp. A375-1]
MTSGARPRPGSSASRAGLALRGVLAWAVLGGTSLAWVADAPAATAAVEQGCGDEAPRYLDQEPPALAQLGAQEAWRFATGDGVVVAVVDSGVDDRNPHLEGAVADGRDVVTGDGTGRTDTWGHGTAVAGIIAARRVADSGVVGLAPGARVLPVRVYHAEGDDAVEQGVQPTPGRIAAGITWAAAQGATIINVSMSTDADDAALRAAVRDATARGSLVVASAGNRNTADDKADDARYPAAYPEVLSVAAVDAELRPTDASIHGEHVDVAAPGAQVLTVYPGAGDCWYATTEPAPSWSTAYASAAAALVAERFPDETPAQWAYRLEVTAARATPDARTDTTGWGVIRPDVALQFVDDGTAAGPPSPVRAPTSTSTVTASPIVVEDTVDPMAQAREGAVWWVLGGTAAVALVALAWRLVSPRRAR